MDQGKLELLHEHYQDTCSLMQSHRRARDRYFYFIIALLVVVIFDLYAPDDFAVLLSEWLKEKLEIRVAPDLRYMRSVIWFLLLGTTIRYCQTALFIERQYTYVHALEEQLAASFGGRAFTREGKAYLANYPAFSTLAHYLYTLVFPVLVALIVIVRTLRELPFCRWWSGLEWFDLMVGVAICVFITLYLFGFHAWTRRRKAS